MPLPAYLTETAIVVVVGTATDSPLVAAVIGGIFLITNSVLNIILLHIFSREERQIARTEERVQTNKATSNPSNRSSHPGISSPRPRRGKRTKKD